MTHLWERGSTFGRYNRNSSALTWHKVHASGHGARTWRCSCAPAIRHARGPKMPTRLQDRHRADRWVTHRGQHAARHRWLTRARRRVSPEQWDYAARARAEVLASLAWLEQLEREMNLDDEAAP